MFDLFGAYAEDIPTNVPAPLFRLQRTGLIIQFVAWRWRVLRHGFTPYLEARWNPTTGKRVTLRGLEACPIGDAKKALQGLRLLRKLAPHGRPAGSTKISLATFPVKCAQAYQQVRERYGEFPEQIDVAEELGISVRTLRDYIRLSGFRWPPA